MFARMRRIQYLTLLVLLLSGSISTWAQDDTFDPTSPAEPAPPGGTATMLTLVADPSDGGTVSGSGWYNPGTMVTVKASAKQNFSFDRWVNEQGETVSTSGQFQYTKKASDETLTALFVFSPGSPAEPSEIAQQLYYQLTVKAEEGGSVSGGGKYLPGTSVRITASASTGYSFEGWYRADNVLLSTAATYYYTTTTSNETLTARFSFTPGSPAEPSEPGVLHRPKHTVTVTATDGGSVNTGGSTLEEGQTIKLTASVNAGYVFNGWYVADTLYSTQSSFTYTMGTADIAFEARFTFNPSAPGEPSQPSSKKYAFYLMNCITKTGRMIDFPVYLTSLDPLGDIEIQLTFPPQLKPTLSTVTLSEKAEGYTVSSEALNDSVYSFVLEGGTVPDGNTAILRFNIAVPIDIGTAMDYPIRINQVSITESNGNVTTASTRNGRVWVYLAGDTNGDNMVDASDVLNIVYVLNGKDTKRFIEEVSDIDEDGAIGPSDVQGIMNIALGTNNQ